MSKKSVESRQIESVELSYSNHAYYVRAAQLRMRKCTAIACAVMSPVSRGFKETLPLKYPGVPGNIILQAKFAIG